MRDRHTGRAQCRRAAVVIGLAAALLGLPALGSPVATDPGSSAIPPVPAASGSWNADNADLAATLVPTGGATDFATGVFNTPGGENWTICSCTVMVNFPLPDFVLTSAVPEPGSLALLGVGAFGLVAVRSRARKQRHPARDSAPSA